MGPLQFVGHLLNFAAPALFLALVLSLGAPLVLGGAWRERRWLAFGVNSLAGVAVLVAGLWVFGRDGAMATYAALVVVVGSSQWLIGRGWRTAR